MADIYMRLYDGEHKPSDIKGEVTVKGYVGWIKLIAFNVSIIPGDKKLDVTKMLDSTSKMLMAAAAKGRRFIVVIDFADGKDGSPSQRITLQDTFISSYSTPGGENRQETLTLEFARITLARSPKAADVSHQTLYKLAQQLQTADQSTAADLV